VERRSIGALSFCILVVGCASDPSCPLSGAPPCPSEVVVFHASCGFTSFTSTCTSAPTCEQTDCWIPVATTETCDASAVLGDGTAHAAHLVVTQRPAPDAGRCVASCPTVSVDVTVDGVDVGGPAAVDISSTTCVAADAGTDAP
jgi:hypothetical protein